MPLKKVLISVTIDQPLQACTRAKVVDSYVQGEQTKTLPSQTQSKRKEPAAVGLIASTNRPTATTSARTIPTVGHHCDACNVHTSCLTRYLAHVSSG